MGRPLPVLAEAAAPQGQLPPAAASARGALAHLARVRALQIERLIHWELRPQDYPLPERAQGRFSHRLYEKALPLQRRDAAAHPLLEAGKRTNLALAAACFDGLAVRPSRPLSFWRTLGRVIAARGFEEGLEVSAGCLVPSLGGGLCLLANGLFELGVWLGWTLHERHGHTLEAVPPPTGEIWGLDATVLWPYVDLRIAPAVGEVRLSVRATAESLILAVDGRRPRRDRVELESRGEQLLAGDQGPVRINAVVRRVRSLATGRLLDERIVARNRRRLLTPHEQGRSCLTCGEVACARRPRERPR